MQKLWLNFKKRIMKENFFTSTVFLVFVCIGFVLFSAIVFPNCEFITEKRRYFISPIPYEKEKWRDFASVSSSKYRPRMARDLVNKNLLIGKTRVEVFEMFGEEKTGKIIKYETEEIFYVIDPIAVEFLKITFDENEKVEKAEIEFHQIGN